MDSDARRFPLDLIAFSSEMVSNEHSTEEVTRRQEGSVEKTSNKVIVQDPISKEQHPVFVAPSSSTNERIKAYIELTVANLIVQAGETRVTVLSPLSTTIDSNPSSQAKCLQCTAKNKPEVDS